MRSGWQAESVDQVEASEAVEADVRGDALEAACWTGNACVVGGEVVLLMAVAALV